MTLFTHSLKFPLLQRKLAPTGIEKAAALPVSLAGDEAHEDLGLLGQGHAQHGRLPGESLGGGAGGGRARSIGPKTARRFVRSLASCDVGPPFVGWKGPKRPNVQL